MSKSNLLEYYQAKIRASKLEANPEQAAVLHYLMQVQEHLIQRKKLSYRLTRIIPRQPIRGLYLWGGVGIGKTMIMDCFYATLPMTKLRLHFHAFMQRLHQELRECQGEVNPLSRIGKRLASQYAVICFDEFLVTNVADAMLLTELLKALFKGGVCLLLTANLSPEQLYENGLQRERFLPAIHLIQQHTRVWHLSLNHDYRRRVLEQIANYYTPLGEEAEQALWHAFLKYTAGSQVTQESLTLDGRVIAVKHRADKVIWFEFKVICGRPRSPHDYLALTQQYSTILVSNVPCLETAAKDLLVSFINLVDILYDSKVQLILSAAVNIEKLYPQGSFRQIFRRTESRLIEMQKILEK